MEQLRQIGEVVGSLKALMVFQEDIHINQRQCSLLLDMFSLAYKTVAGDMRQALKFEEKDTKWKVLEQPLRDLQRVIKEGESYIRQSLESENWWAKAITLHQDKSCVEFHVHNLLSCVYIVVEAIESAGEIAGKNHEEILKKKAIYSMKYQRDFKDPKIFQWRFGKQYLVSQDLCDRIAKVWEEDRWILLNKVGDKRNLRSTKYEKRLADILLKNLDVSKPSNDMFLPSSTLVGSKDYQVRRRLGSGSQYKEIQWLGESFAMRHFFGEIEPVLPHISKQMSLSHPNIMTILCGFVDDDKKECFLVMELMNRDLSSYTKEIRGARKRIPFSPPTSVDLMLQIARGMEYLHSKQVYHGDLNSSNILIKSRNSSPEGYLHAKVSGFGQSLPTSLQRKSSPKQNDAQSFIWHAPEVIAEEERLGDSGTTRYTEKSDVYSFGMICFELLTGKVPSEDGHLQGDKMTQHIRSGERPLFPLSVPKYLTNLTKRCWHADPNQRPSFASICRILRFIKRFLAMNPNHDQDLPFPVVDYCEIEAGLLKSFHESGSSGPSPVSQIPFQMFAYTLSEKEKANTSLRESSESGSDGTSTFGEESISSSSTYVKTPPRSPETKNKKQLPLYQTSAIKSHNQPGTPKRRSTWTPPISPRGYGTRLNTESQVKGTSPRLQRINSESQIKGTSPRLQRINSESQIKGTSLRLRRINSELQIKGTSPRPQRTSRHDMDTDVLSRNSKAGTHRMKTCTA